MFGFGFNLDAVEISFVPEVFDKSSELEQADLLIKPSGTLFLLAPVHLGDVADHESSCLFLSTEADHTVRGVVQEVAGSVLDSAGAFALAGLELLPATRALLAAALEHRDRGQGLGVALLEGSETTPDNPDGFFAVGDDGKVYQPEIRGDDADSGLRVGHHPVHSDKQPAEGEFDLGYLTARYFRKPYGY